MIETQDLHRQLMQREIESLREQLAECQKERDEIAFELRHRSAELSGCFHQLTAAQARIAELVEALEAMVSYAREEGKGLKMADDALSRTDNMEALEAYRDQVIQDCIDTAHRNGVDFHIGNALDALKKEKR